MNNKSHDSGTTALDEDLARVLREAPLPAGTDGWADLVMTRSRRRTRMSVLAAGTAACLVAVGVALASHQTTTSAVPAATQSSTADVSATPTTSTPSAAASPTPTPSPSAASSWPTYASPPQQKEASVEIGRTVELPYGLRLVLRPTSLCSLDPGQSIEAHDVNCGYVRNGNTAPGSFTEEGYGTKDYDLVYGIGDKQVSRITVQLQDGTFVPVTLIHPVGETWTGYYAIAPARDVSKIQASLSDPNVSRAEKHRLLQEEMASPTLRVYDGAGRLVQEMPSPLPSR